MLKAEISGRMLFENEENKVVFTLIFYILVLSCQFACRSCMLINYSFLSRKNLTPYNISA